MENLPFNTDNYSNFRGLIVNKNLGNVIRANKIVEAIKNKIIEDPVIYTSLIENKKEYKLSELIRAILDNSKGIAQDILIFEETLDREKA